MRPHRPGQEEWLFYVWKREKTERKLHCFSSPYPQPFLVQRALESFLIHHQCAGPVMYPPHVCFKVWIYQAPVTDAVLLQRHHRGDP